MTERVSFPNKLFLLFSNVNKPYTNIKIEPGSLQRKLTDVLGRLKTTIKSIFSTGETHLDSVDRKRTMKLIEKEKAKLFRNINSVWNSYIDLLKLSPTLIKKHHEAKYFRLYGKMVDRRTIARRSR